MKGRRKGKNKNQEGGDAKEDALESNNKVEMVFVISRYITELEENENHIPIIQIGTVQRAPEKKLLPQGC